MIIEEAIQLIKDLRDFSPIKNAPRMKKALNLAIEALEWRLHCERVNAPARYTPLPGETEE